MKAAFEEKGKLPESDVDEGSINRLDFPLPQLEEIHKDSLSERKFDFWKHMITCAVLLVVLLAAAAGLRVAIERSVCYASVGEKCLPYFYREDQEPKQ